MQNYKQIIYERLTSDAEITSFVGSRVYPLKAPRPTTQGDLQDVIIYNRISDKANHASIRRGAYQISVYSGQQLKADQIASRVVYLFSRYVWSGVRTFIDWNISETYDQQTKDFGIHVPIGIKSVDTTF